MLSYGRVDLFDYLFNVLIVMAPEDVMFVI